MAKERQEENTIPEVNEYVRAAVGAACALPFIGLEYLGMGTTGLVAAGVTGIVGYVYADKIGGFVRERMPQMEERGDIKSWLMSSGIREDSSHAMKRREVKMEQAASTVNEDDHWSFDDDNTPMPSSGGKVLFSSILADGFTPSLNKIYLGSHPGGSPIYVAAKDLCHVALAGATGNGKSSIMRLLMAQLCKIRVRVLLLNPHYTRYDRDSGEDWTPFEKYLEKSPMEYAEYSKIGEALQWMAKTELPKRIQRVREGKSAGRPFFVIIDELPAIVGEVKDAPAYISKLLREGRKYGIFLIVASQDFLVKTTGMDGGAVRKCFRTAFYVGGDQATARALLESGSPIAETKLGKGVIAIRCKDTQEAVEARVPYVDNEAVYAMLGPSTFNDGAPQTEQLSEDDSLSFAQLYDQMTQGQEQEIVDSPAQERLRLPEPMQDEEAQNIILGKDAFITKEQFRLAIKLREVGKSTGYRDLMDFFDLSEHHAKALNARIRQELGLEAK